MTIPFTREQAESVIACCRRETERRKRGLSRYTPQYLALSGIGPETRRMIETLADVESAALAVLDGLEGAQELLQEAMEAADYHPLWTASAVPVVKRRAA